MILFGWKDLSTTYLSFCFYSPEILPNVCLMLFQCYYHFFDNSLRMLISVSYLYYPKMTNLVVVTRDTLFAFHYLHWIVCKSRRNQLLKQLITSARCITVIYDPLRIGPVSRHLIVNALFQLHTSNSHSNLFD